MARRDAGVEPGRVEPDRVEQEGVEREREARARREADLDEQEQQSFPASDPHSDWAGAGPGLEHD